MTVKKFLRTSDTYRNTPGFIKDGKMYAIYQGKEIEESEFRKMFPVPETLLSKGVNPNRKMIALS